LRKCLFLIYLLFLSTSNYSSENHIEWIALSDTKTEARLDSISPYSTTELGRAYGGYFDPFNVNELVLLNDETIRIWDISKARTVEEVDVEYVQEVCGFVAISQIFPSLLDRNRMLLVGYDHHLDSPKIAVLNLMSMETISTKKMSYALESGRVMTFRGGYDERSFLDPHSPRLLTVHHSIKPDRGCFFSSYDYEKDRLQGRGFFLRDMHPVSNFVGFDPVTPDRLVIDRYKLQGRVDDNWKIAIWDLNESEVIREIDSSLTSTPIHMTKENGSVYTFHRNLMRFNLHLLKDNEWIFKVPRLTDCKVVTRLVPLREEDDRDDIEGRLQMMMEKISFFVISINHDSSVLTSPKCLIDSQ